MLRKTAAFNLIELLTVIAIIGILATILVPVAGRVREQARFASCTSNLRQWGAANLLYANDNHGLIPWDGQTAGAPTPDNMALHMGTLPWFNALPPYIDSPIIADLHAAGSLPRLGDNSVFVCPSAQRNGETPDWLCYGPNYLLSTTPANPTQGGRPTITRLDHIREPNRVPLFAETTNHAGGSTAFFSNANPRYLKDALRHGDRAPVVFFDGHVEAFTHEDLRLQAIAATNPNAPLSVRWNPLHQ